MTHIYSAGGSRRSAVFTAIIGLHFALFLVVIDDRIHVVREKAHELPRVTLLPPQPQARDVVPPDAPEKVEAGRVVVLEPVIYIPPFEDSKTAPTPSTVGEGANQDGLAPQPAPVERVAASLQGRSKSFADVVRACYPAGARRDGEEGKVLIAVTIGAQGLVRSWRVVQGSGFQRLDIAVQCVLDRLSFNAAREGGRAVQSEVLLPIVFRLD